MEKYLVRKTLDAIALLSDSGFRFDLLFKTIAYWYRFFLKETPYFWLQIRENRKMLRFCIYYISEVQLKVNCNKENKKSQSSLILPKNCRVTDFLICNQICKLHNAWINILGKNSNLLCWVKRLKRIVRNELWRMMSKDESLYKCSLCRYKNLCLLSIQMNICIIYTIIWLGTTLLPLSMLIRLRFALSRGTISKNNSYQQLL